MTAYLIGVSLGVGTAIAGLWAMLVATRRVPELDERKPSIRFHIAAELFTAALLLIGGVALWLDASWARTVVAAAVGAALYTCIASPGYYADRGERGPVAMFGVLVILLGVALIFVILG